MYQFAIRNPHSAIGIRCLRLASRPERRGDPGAAARTQSGTCRHVPSNVRPCRLQTLKQLVILGVRADPEPVDMIGLSQSQRPVAETDPDGVDWLPLADPLELKAWVIRI